jgi:hypothetical protein
MRPAKPKNGKIALLVKILPETHARMTRRSFLEKKTLAVLVDEAFAPPSNEEVFANLDLFQKEEPVLT